MTTFHLPSEICWQQIEIGVKMSLGVRKMHTTNDGKTLRMEVGPVRSPRMVDITINSHDLYDVLCTRTKRDQNRTVVFQFSAGDVDATLLNETLLRMERECWG